MLEFVNWDELAISHITFHNVELVLNGCSNSVIDSIEVKNNQYDSFFQIGLCCVFYMETHVY